MAFENDDSGYGTASNTTSCISGPNRGSTFPRERAALEWTEALTLASQTHAPDAAYDAVKAQFTKEIVDLTMLIGTINAWNRLVIGLRSVHPTSVSRTPLIII